MASQATERALRGEGTDGYTRRRRPLLAGQSRKAALVLALSRRPGLASAALTLLGCFPRLFSALLGA